MYRIAWLRAAIEYTFQWKLYHLLREVIILNGFPTQFRSHKMPTTRLSSTESEHKWADRAMR